MEWVKKFKNPNKFYGATKRKLSSLMATPLQLNCTLHTSTQNLVQTQNKRKIMKGKLSLLVEPMLCNPLL